MPEILSRLECLGRLFAKRTPRPKAGLLLAQVRFFDLRVGGDFGGGALQADRSRLEDVGAIGVLQGRVGVLLDEEHGSSLPVNLLDRLADRVDEDRSESERRLV